MMKRAIRASSVTVSVMSRGAGHVEVEQDRDVVTLAEFLTYRVKHRLTVIRESAEDQHHLGCDCVDDAADFLVVEEEVDELGDFEIVHGESQVL